MNPGHRVRQVGRQMIRALTTPLSAILMYHRVGSPSNDPFDLTVSPENFRAQMLEIRRRGFTSLTASEMAGRIGAGRLPKLSICITFDDGYADNFAIAWPILRELEMSATIFTVAGSVGSDEEFWWDALERIFLSPGLLPPRLDLPKGGRIVPFDLGDAVRYSDTDRTLHQGWSAEHPPPTPRHAAMLRVYAAFSAMSPVERAKALPALRSFAGLDGAREARRAMSSAELASIAEDPRIEIAAHTLTHPRLSDLAEEDQRTEIESSRSMLEQIIGRPVTGFSYPHGKFNDTTLRLVRAAGFDYACTSQQRPLGRGEDLFTLPRLVVPNLDGPVFGDEVLSRIGPSALGPLIGGIGRPDRSPFRQVGYDCR